MAFARRTGARWVSRIATSAAGVWAATLGVQLFHQAAHLELSVPLPDVPTAAFMTAFYLSVRVIAQRIATRAAVPL